ncbi:MAG: reverse transcriptase domain-containing protein, partial [Nitrososphaera sp.]|nr:reverse transcriptase domain-containing protein [Nitrososphaera sp.]
MLLDSGAEVSLVKVGRIKGEVMAEDGVITLRGIGGTPVATLCKVRLSIRVGDRHISHPCYAVKDDFPLEADGLLGGDFLEKHDVELRSGKYARLYGTTWNLGATGAHISLERRSEKIIRAKTRDDAEGIVEGIELQPGVYMGSCITSAVDGECNVSILNTNDYDVELEQPCVQIVALGQEYTDTAQVYACRTTTPSNASRMQLLRDNLRTSHLNREEKESLLDVCERFHDVFHLEGDYLGYTNAASHRITTNPDIAPINVRPYRLPEKHKQEINEQVKKMLAEGIIRPSKSQWNAPLLVVPKKADASGKTKMRVVVDFRKVNDITVGDSFPLPNITEILDQLGKAKYFSTLDLASGFHQIPMEEEDKCKTAFSTPHGHYEHNRMPFGLKNAPATFQRLMNTVLTGIQGLRCYVYLDDIVIHAPSLQEHNKRLEEVLERLRHNSLKLQPDKCEFLRKEVNFLGHVITSDGIKADPEKIRAVKQFPIPKAVKDVQAFLGLAGYYRRFIRNFSSLAKPLTHLLKKEVKFGWTSREQEAFENLKKTLTTAPILQYPDFEQPFIVTTDASDKAIGAVLSQGIIGSDLPIAYASRTLNSAEGNYSTTEKELLAIVWAVNHFRPYVYCIWYQIQNSYRSQTANLVIRSQRSWITTHEMATETGRIRLPDRVQGGQGE